MGISPKPVGSDVNSELSQIVGCLAGVEELIGVGKTPHI